MLGIPLRHVHAPHHPIDSREPMDLEWLCGRISGTDAERLFVEYLGLPTPRQIDKISMDRELDILELQMREALDIFEEAQIQLRSSGVEPYFLREWFKHESWSRDEAIALLLGIIPARSENLDFQGLFRILEDEASTQKRTAQVIFARDLFGCAIDKNGYPNATTVRLMMLKGRIADPGLCPVPGETMLALTIDLQRLEDLWDSGQHADRNSPAYVVAWARRKGIEVPWLGWAQSSGLLTPEVPEAAPTNVSSAPAGLPETGEQGVTSTNIAIAFAGLYFNNAAAWKKALSDPSKRKWLLGCRVTAGRAGRTESTWNPVDIGVQLVLRGATGNQVRARFQRFGSPIAGWFDRWLQAQSDSFPDA